MNTSFSAFGELGMCFKLRLSRMYRRDRIVVSTLRCGRNNPGSNPGHGNVKVLKHY